MNTRHLLKLTALATTWAALSAFAADKPSDYDINYWVKDALRNDATVKPFDITTSTVNGIVTLSGTVSNIAAKELPVQEAMKIRGVVGVVDKITVTPGFRWDADIAQDVRRRIVNSATIDSQEIHTTCVAGVVKLTGKVASWAEVQQAGLLASEVRGVKAVTNDLWADYKPNRSDQELKNDATAALGRDVYTAALPITVTVKDRVLTLEGKVGSPYEKERAGEDVRWLVGVKDAHNNLKVEAWENRGVRKQYPVPSEADIRQAVLSALKQDPRVDAGEIVVNASLGTVTLDGPVPNHSQVATAEQDAHNVVGVGWVINHLYSRAERRDDAAIWADAMFSLDTDYTLQGQDIPIKVKDGIATLSGSVGSRFDRTHATDVVARVRGVKSVINTMTVNGNRHSDAELTKELKERLKWNWATGTTSDRIGSTVVNGVATLTGDVDAWYERQEAGRVALRTEGVTAVDNRLTVRGFKYKWDEWHFSAATDPYTVSSLQP